MTIIYIRHDVTTLAEVNALALTDRQQNDAIVLSEDGYTCAWSLPYQTRNEGVGRWEYGFDGVGYDYLEDGDKMAVLVPVEAEEQYVAPDAITYSRYVAAWEEA